MLSKLLSVVSPSGETPLVLALQGSHLALCEHLLAVLGNQAGLDVGASFAPHLHCNKLILPLPLCSRALQLYQMQLWVQSLVSSEAAENAARTAAQQLSALLAVLTKRVAFDEHAEVARKHSGLAWPCSLTHAAACHRCTARV